MDYVVGPSNEFVENIARELDAETIELERHVFADNEIRPRVLLDGKDLSGKEVLLVNRQKSGEEADPNRYLMEFYLTVKNLKEQGAEVDVFMPYLVYAMQDKVFREGEPNSAVYVFDLLKEAGARRAFVVSSHMQREEGRLDFYTDLEVHNISGFPAIGEYVKENYDLDYPFVVGPDFTAGEDAKIVADILGASSEAIYKERDKDNYETKIEYDLEEAKDKDVVIVDDIAETGGTLSESIKACKEKGARNIISAVVHPVLAGNCLEKVSSEGEFIACNTIDSPISKIRIEKTVADYIHGL